MQLRKRNWRINRDKLPCCICGEDKHTGTECHLTKKGKRKDDLLRTIIKLP